MNPSVRRGVVGFLLFYSALLALGYFVGHKDGLDSAGKDATDPTVQRESGQQASVVSPLNGVAVNKSAGTPVDLKNLNGKEFIESLPALEALARHGDVDVIHVLIQRLGSCGTYHVASDEEIREQEESNYQRELNAVKFVRDHPNGHPVDPAFSAESVLHEHEAALKAAFDQRDMCKALTPRQIEGRFDWVRVALERHDRQTILNTASPGNGIGSGEIERVRNAEKLNEIAQIERSDLDALIATGDTTALERAAYAFGSGSNSFLRRDAVLAYTYAYAWTLTDATSNAWQQNGMKELMQQLASGDGFFAPLTSTEIDEASTRGLAIFQSCCASGVR